MDTSGKDFYDNHFKTKVALEANCGTSISDLSQKYSVPVPKIKNWVQSFKKRVNLLFEEKSSSHNNIAVNNQTELLASSFETSPNGILVTDLDRNIIAYNKRFIEVWKLPAELVTTNGVENVISHLLDSVKNPLELKQAVEEASQHPHIQSSQTIALKDGRFLKRHSSPYRTPDGIEGRITNFIEITEYKKTEQKLTKFSNLLQSINRNVNEGLLRSTPDKGLLYVNDAFVEMFGYHSKKEVMKKAPAEFYANPKVQRRLLQRLKSGEHFKNAEVLFKRKDGTTFWGLENSTLVKENGEVYIDGVITNIDERKKAKQELRTSEKKYRSILKNIEEGYFETDLKGNFSFFNAKLVDMMGYPVREMIGMNYRRYVEEDEARKVHDTFNKVYRTGKPKQAFDWELIRGDGARIYVEVSITLRKNSKDEPTGFGGMVRDITERKRKRRKIKESLKEKEVLLSEIHHRVKNNLAVISGLLYLQADKTADPKAKHALRESQNRISSMALIHELLYDNQSFSSLNPQQYIEQLVQHISPSIAPEQTDITTKIKAGDFDLEMSTAVPCALIINEFITNAYKHAFTGQDEGTITILFRKEKNGRHHLKVTDDGCGLPADFDLDDSSHHSLGLSLVKTLTRQLGGKLESRNDKGAQFVITF